MFARLKTDGSRNLLLEVAMIVVGINIALWFEGWFNDLEDAETEQQYLAGLRDDLRTDLKQLDAVIKFNANALESLGEIIPELATLPDAGPEAQTSVMFVPSSYLFFEPSDFTYRSMQESGDFRLLSDDDTKKRLLRLVRNYRLIDTLQQNFIQAMDDEYIPLMMSSFDILAQRLTDPAILDDQVFKNFFPYTYQDIETRLVVYKSVREQTRELLEVVEAQIKD
jgi:ABC-type transporter Mla subunit MlaD